MSGAGIPHDPLLWTVPHEDQEMERDCRASEPPQDPLSSSCSHMETRSLSCFPSFLPFLIYFSGVLWTLFPQAVMEEEEVGEEMGEDPQSRQSD